MGRNNVPFTSSYPHDNWRSNCSCYHCFFYYSWSEKVIVQYYSFLPQEVMLFVCLKPCTTFKSQSIPRKEMLAHLFLTRKFFGRKITFRHLIGLDTLKQLLGYKTYRLLNCDSSSYSSLSRFNRDQKEPSNYPSF